MDRRRTNLLLAVVKVVAVVVCTLYFSEKNLESIVRYILLIRVF